MNSPSSGSCRAAPKSVSLYTDLQQTPVLLLTLLLRAPVIAQAASSRAVCSSVRCISGQIKLTDWLTDCSGVTRWGTSTPRVTTSVRWHPDESKNLWLNFTKSTGVTITWKAGGGWEWWRWVKKIVSFFSGKNRATPAVTASPGDTNLVTPLYWLMKYWPLRHAELKSAS